MLNVPLTDGPVVLVDVSSGQDTLFTLTLGNDRTISNPATVPAHPLEVGRRVGFRLTQDAIGGWGVTWGSAYTFATGHDEPTLSTTAGASDYVEFVYNGLTYDCVEADIADHPAGAAGGLFGAKTIVVSTAGDDTAGAASPYTAEFLTLAAATAAATAGDTVVVRPGAYSIAGGSGGIGKTGVNWHWMDGAVITLASGRLLNDSATGLVMSISGAGEFVLGANATAMVFLNDTSATLIQIALRKITGSGSNLVVSTGHGVLEIDCPHVDVPSTYLLYDGGGATMRLRAGYVNCRRCIDMEIGTCNISVQADTIATSDREVVYAADGNATSYASVRARRITAATAAVVKVNNNLANIVVEASESIIGAQILLDNGSTGATRVSIRAPKITATDAGDYAIAATNAGAARYDIDCDALIGALSLNAAACELHLRARSHAGHVPGGAAVYALAGQIFARWDECRPHATTTDGVLAVNLTGILHVLSGRIIGPNVAGGAAAMLFADTADLRLYPGAVLIAGGAAAASIALGGAAATPTVLAMGAIAANKAVEAGVIVAVGSLLVDSAVV